jgi:erythromycin esterase
MHINAKLHDLNSAKDLDPLINAIGDRSIVMLGEASHGTHEYYTWRTEISKRLIEEKGFSFIAVEGDWPDCYKINRYIKGYHDSGNSINEILHAFNRWPTWMWANWEVAALAECLKEHNSKMPFDKRIGFYGLDVYSLWESMEAIINYLEKEDPKAFLTAKKAFKCFEPYGEEGQLYGHAVVSLSHSCKEQVLNLLREIREKARYYDGDREAALNAEQNAMIAVNAEKYYRTMMGFDNQSWNVRDIHMAETLQRLMKFHGPKAKGIVWEHNTHIGDARFTDMKRAGMVNIGQLAREQYGQDKVFLTGFGSYQGTVIAGDEWGAAMQVMNVPPAKDESIEAILHKKNPSNQLLVFNDRNNGSDKSVPHRAIGVVYNPLHERHGNYVPTVMSSRYDAFIFIDETKALHPMHIHPDGHKTPETYPFGI